MAIDEPTTLESLLGLYRSDHAQIMYDEAVTEREHALQAATAAEADGADDALIVAALLHDVGHLILRDLTPIGEELTVDHRHDHAGADRLAEVFGPEVSEPVRGHVAAKRYLCATEDGYFDLLSPSSVRSLRVQGGPMSDAEVAEFEQQPGWERVVRLRRYDEAAKIGGLTVPNLDSWLSLLKSVAL